MLIPVFAYTLLFANTGPVTKMLLATVIPLFAALKLTVPVTVPPVNDKSPLALLYADCAKLFAALAWLNAATRTTFAPAELANVYALFAWVHAEFAQP